MLLEDSLQSFLNNKETSDLPISFVTSGGTKVNLEKNTVRFIDNFSTGERGALSTEILLKSDYKVIFLYRKGSIFPFTSHFRSNISKYVDGNLLNSLVIDGNKKLFKGFSPLDLF